MRLKKGVYWALLAALISGVAIFVNKFAVGAIQPPLVFTATKNTGVALLVISWIVMSGKWRDLKKLGSAKQNIIGLVLIGVVGGAVPFYLFFTGLAQIPAINAALIHKSLVLWVALLTWPLLKERLSGLQILAIVILFGSNLVVGGFEGFKYSTGELMVLGATVLWAVEQMIIKLVVKEVDPDLIIAFRLGIGSIILLSMSFWMYPGFIGQVLSLSVDQFLWMLVTMITLVSTLMAWYRALKMAPVILVATILVGATLVTNVLSAIFVTHQWTWEMGLQAGLIISGVGLFVAVAEGRSLRLRSRNLERI